MLAYFTFCYRIGNRFTMTPYQKRVTAFTKRMAEDMQLRNLSPRTIDAYTYHVDRFAMRFGKHPEELDDQ